AHRIGVVQRLKTMSTTGAIGKACSGSTSIRAPVILFSVSTGPSPHYFPLGTYCPATIASIESTENSTTGSEHDCGDWSDGQRWTAARAGARSGRRTGDGCLARDLSARRGG